MAREFSLEKLVISVSWLTLMLVKRLRLNVFFITGRIHKIGETHEGASYKWTGWSKNKTVVFYHICCITAAWEGHRVNIIDTPGHVDFTVEVERSLRVLDGAVTVLDAQSGVEPQTETVWRQATTYGVPRIVFVNKMDKLGANFEYSVSTLHDRLQANAAPIQLPIGAEDEFEAIIDLVEMKCFKYTNDLGTEIEEIEIPEDHLDRAEEARASLIEAVAETSDELMEKYLGDEEISVSELSYPPSYY